MKGMKINTTIKLDGMDKLKELLAKQYEILTEFNKNVAEIEGVARSISVDLSIEKATS